MSEGILERIWRALDAVIPPPLFAITEATVWLHFLAHLPVIFFAYLLFSPRDTRTLRLSLMPPAVLLALSSGFLFPFADPARGEQTKGLRVTGLIWAMRAIEVGSRSKRPHWVGWEQHEKGRVRNDLIDRQVDDKGVLGRRPRLRFALSYVYGYRCLGWSTGPKASRYGREARAQIPRAPRSRWTIACKHLVRVVLYLLAMDTAVGAFTLHPHFGRMATASQGSIYMPLQLVPFLPPLPSLASACLVAAAWGFCIYISQAFPGALVGFLTVLLVEDPESADLHYPPLFRKFWAANSIRSLWR